MKKYLCIILFSIITISSWSQEKVGINIDPPQFTLDVRSLINDDPAEIHLGNPGDTRFLRLFSGSSTFIHPSLYWKDGHHLRFATDLGGFSEKMRIQSDGRVGIGTLTPAGQLHIVNNSSIPFPQLRITEDANDFARIKMENTAFPNAYWDLAGNSDGNPDLARLNFFYSNGTTSGDRMTVMGNGNVGIGTTSPVSKLDIVSTGDGAEILRLSNERPWVFKQTGSGVNANLTLQSTVNGKNFEILGSDGLTKSAIFTMWDTNPTVILVPENGNVGIGETNPGNRLRIKGNSTSSQHVLSVSSTYSGNSNIRAIEGFSIPADGYGFGGLFEGGSRGIQAAARGGASTGLVIGVEGSSYGTNGERIGVFGRASGGSKNWAGYFAEGNMYITNDLRIGLGAKDGATGYKVAIDGKVIAEEMRVQLSGAWPDYVFKEDYNLMPLNELEKEIKELGHLPGMPSAEKAEAEGIMLGDMNRMLLEKIEELTLHIIRLQKEIQELKTYKANKDVENK